MEYMAIIGRHIVQLPELIVKNRPTSLDFDGGNLGEGTIDTIGSSTEVRIIWCPESIVGCRYHGQIEYEYRLRTRIRGSDSQI